jgi:hypothetical protein
MTVALSPEERLERADREVASVQRLCIDAVAQLQGAPEIDGTFDERWEGVASRLRGLRAALEFEDFDKRQLAEISNALLDIRDALDRIGDSRDMDAFDQLLVQLERIRHVVRDALDEYVSGVRDDVGLVMADLDRWLPHVSRHELAEIAGVDRRTLTRWAGKAGRPPRRLRLVASLVAILRHSWTEDGVVAWFHRPRRDLGGRTPLAALADRSLDEEMLLDAARAGRSQYAT